MFGPKKGVLTTYAGFWNFKYYEMSQIIVNFLNFDLRKAQTLNHYLLYRFQFTIITCRTTVYILFSFWLFFFFFGESLLLVLFNFASVTDSVYGNYFFTFKNHNIFSINSFSGELASAISFYIAFFAACAFIFLINLRYTFNYFYLNNLWMLDAAFIGFVFYLFFGAYVFVVVALLAASISRSYFYDNDNKFTRFALKIVKEYF